MAKSGYVADQEVLAEVTCVPETVIVERGMEILRASVANTVSIAPANIFFVQKMPSAFTPAAFLLFYTVASFGLPHEIVVLNPQSVIHIKSRLT